MRGHAQHWIGFGQDDEAPPIESQPGSDQAPDIQSQPGYNPTFINPNVPSTPGAQTGTNPQVAVITQTGQPQAVTDAANAVVA